MTVRPEFGGARGISLAFASVSAQPAGNDGRSTSAFALPAAAVAKTADRSSAQIRIAQSGVCTGMRCKDDKNNGERGPGTTMCTMGGMRDVVRN